METKHTYGVFVHTGTGRYNRADAIDNKAYASEKVAQRKADKLNETNPVYVVRTLEYCSN